MLLRIQPRIPHLYCIIHKTLISKLPTECKLLNFPPKDVPLLARYSDSKTLFPSVNNRMDNSLYPLINLYSARIKHVKYEQREKIYFRLNDTDLRYDN